MNTQIFMLEGISLDEDIQSRVEVSEEYVREYAKDMLGEQRFPPVTIFNDGEKYYLADGYHRYEASKLAGLETIRAVVKDGSKRDAILFAVSCNATHGKRRTNDDKRKAVGKLLLDPEWRKWSDNEIAKRCRVSQPFVGKLRKQPPYNDYKLVEKRLCSNGQLMVTSKIGCKSKTNTSKILHPTQRPLSDYQQFILDMEKANAAPTVLHNPYTYEDDPDLLKQNLIRVRKEFKLSKKYTECLEAKIGRLKKENQLLKKELARANAG